MGDTSTRDRRKRPHGGASELRVVRVFDNPGPDAEDRLRRLVSLLLKYATRDGQSASEKDSPPDARHIGDCPEAEG